MKNSGVEWIGDIPEGWDILPLARIFRERKRKNKGLTVHNVLSLSYGKIVKRNIDNNQGLLPESFETYNIVKPDNIILRLTDMQNDQHSLRTGLVRERGIITSAYLTLEKTFDAISGFFHYLLHTYDVMKIIYNMGNGVRQNLKYSELAKLPLLVPDVITQQRIASSLDKKCSQIDAIIEKQQKVIEKLNEYKQSIITEAVTKGLDPDVPMKDSGVEWSGYIPDHWNTIKLKYTAETLRGKFNHRPRNDPSYYDGQYPFVQTGDVAQANKFIAEYSQTLNELGYSVSKEFPKGSVVMSIAANIGDVAVLNFNACFPDSVVGFVPKANTHWNYLFYVLKSMKNQFIRNAIISTQLNINIEIIKSETIPIAPYKEQENISNFLDKKCVNIDTCISYKTLIVEKLSEYKKSLIFEAVTGKTEV